MVSAELRAWPIALLLIVSGAGLCLEGGLASGKVKDWTGPDFQELEVTEAELNGVLGGGNFIGIRNEDNDAMIGVLYGTEKHPNNVYIITVFTRYMGVADIYDKDGNRLVKDSPLAVRTLYAQRFDNIYEFSDTNEDGIWDSSRADQKNKGNGKGEEENMTVEPVFSRVSLDTSWTAHDIEKSVNENGSVQWNVSLRAADLPYESPILGKPLKGSEALDLVELTFHLYVQREDVKKEGIPAYRVEVNGGDLDGYKIRSAERLADRSKEGSTVSASVKYDHLISGWDFGPTNENGGLMLSTELLFLTGASKEMSELLSGLTEDDIEGNGTVDYETATGRKKVTLKEALQVPEGDPVVSSDAVKPQLVKKYGLGINDNWQRIGEVEWDPAVTVDGREEGMAFQVYMARIIRNINVNSVRYSGMGVVGGYSYPGGGRIYHDPTFEISSFEVRPATDGPEVDRPDMRRTLLIVGGILAAAVAVLIILVLVIAIIVVAVRGDKMGPKKKEDEDHYEGYYMSKGRT